MKTFGLVVGNALGKLCGLLREITLAYCFGASAASDAFRVSLTAALVPTHFFMGDVLEGAFVPLYTKLHREEPAAARRLLGLLVIYLAVVSGLIGLLLWTAGGYVVRLVGPGLAPGTVDLASRIVRWMALGVPVYCLAHLTALQGLTLGKVRALALRSLALNIGFVAAIPAAAALHDPQWIGLGFTLALVAYLALARREVHTSGEPTLVLTSKGAGAESRLLLRAIVPLIGVMLLGQLLALVDRVAASFVGVGALASLEYARSFVEVPQVLIGAAMATTSLSRFVAVPDEEVSSGTAELVLPLITASLGCLLALAVAAPDVVTVVYQRGRFDSRAVDLVSMAVRGMAVGGGFFPAAYVMIRILNARLRSHQAVTAMAIGVAVAAAANVVLVPRLGLLGVSLSTSMGYVAICVVVARQLGLLTQLVRRLPAWLVGAGLGAGLGIAASFPLASLELSSWVRAPLLAATALGGFVLGCGIGSGARSDLWTVRAHLLRLSARWRAGAPSRAP
jgi:putative peptidoglycan lipid II flippase